MMQPIMILAYQQGPKAVLPMVLNPSGDATNNGPTIDDRLNKYKYFITYMYSKLNTDLLKFF